MVRTGAGPGAGAKSSDYGAPKVMLALAAKEVAAWFREATPVLKLAVCTPAKAAPLLFTSPVVSVPPAPPSGELDPLLTVIPVTVPASVCQETVLVFVELSE
jgi:hypothetical protein